MADLTVTTLELWPRKAHDLLHAKGLSERKLRKRFHDHILFPWNDNYDQQRMLFETQIQERPLFILRPECEEEVVSALNLLKEYNLTIRIVGGRHSPALQNPDIFLDVSFFTSIRLGKRYLHVGAGATQGQVNAYLFSLDPKYHHPGACPNHPNSLVFPGGSASTVGSAGISTVGGIGTLRRTLGLAIDSIVSFKIVLPPTRSEPARVVKSSEKEHSELFFGLRGGLAANFGIVLQINYLPLKVDSVILYDISWPWSEAERVINQWQATAPGRPNTFTEDLSTFTILPAIPRAHDPLEESHIQAGITLEGLYVLSPGQSEEQARITIEEEVSSLGGKLTIHPARDYAGIYEQFVAARVYHSYSAAKTILTAKHLPADLIVERIERARFINGRALIGMQLMLGKISEVPSDATAYFPREVKFFLDIFNFWDSVVDQAANSIWNRITFEELYEHLGPYVYLGFPISHLPDHLNAYYGENKERLLRIKRRIDPLNLLHFPGSL